MTVQYTPRELARAAGYVLRSMPTGGAVERLLGDDVRILELGPDATDEEIVRLARRYLAGPVFVAA
jgi:hypothetical protein